MFNHTSICTSLRPDSAARALVPALPPAPLNLPDGCRPLLALDGDDLVMARGSAVVIARGQSLADPVQLDGVPLRAIRTDSRTFVVVTAKSLYVFDFDPAAGAYALRPDFPAMLPALRTVAAATVSVPVAPVDCNLGAIQAGGVSRADARRFAASARQAYIALSDAARAAGACVHPRLARVRALSSDGALLFVTEPVLLTHPDGDEPAGRFQFDASASTAGFAASADFSAPAWRPRLDMPQALVDALPRGAVVEVLMSDSFPAFDPDAAPSVSPRRRSSDPLVTVALPLADADIPAALAAPMRRAFATSRTAPTLDFSFSPRPRVDVGPAAPILTAAHAASTASVVAWAAPAVRRLDPPSASSLAISVADAPWHAAVAVEFADGSSQVTLSSGLTGAPVLFSPLISYPAPDAVAIEVTVSSGGEVRTGRYPLVADPGASRAVFCAPDLRPFHLPRLLDAFVPPVAAPVVHSLPASVAVAAADSPLCPFAFVAPGAARVRAVVPAAVGQSVWDYGRSRFYVFSDSGIYLLGVDPARRTASVSLIDSRVVASPSAVVRVDGAVAAIASGDVVLLSGRRVTRILHLPAAVALAYSHADHELWCLTPSATEVVCLDRDNLRYTVPAAFSPDTLEIAYGTCCLTASDGSATFIAGHGAAADMVEIAFEATLDIPREALSAMPSRGTARSTALPRGYDRPLMLVLDIPGRYSALRISVTRTDTLSAAPAPDFQATVDGRVSAPLRFPLPVPPTARAIRLRIAGLASPDSLLRSASLLNS